MGASAPVDLSAFVPPTLISPDDFVYARTSLPPTVTADFDGTAATSPGGGDAAAEAAALRVAEPAVIRAPEGVAYDAEARQWVRQVFPSLGPAGRQDAVLLERWLRYKEEALEVAFEEAGLTASVGVLSGESEGGDDAAERQAVVELVTRLKYVSGKAMGLMMLLTPVFVWLRVR